MTLDLRSSEIEHKFIHDRINFVEYLMSQLCIGFSAYNRKCARQRDSGDKLAKVILKLASKEVFNPTLRIALGQFSDIIHAIQDYREAKVQRVDHRVILEFSSYSQICKQSKEQLKRSFATRAKELTKKVKLEKIRGKKPTNWQEITKAEKEADRARADANQATLQLSHEVDSFERKKLDDIKRVLLDFINIELMFHAKALELYTKAFQIIEGINPNEDLQEFRSHFRFPSVAHNMEANCLLAGSGKASDDASKALLRLPSKAHPSTAIRNEALLEGIFDTSTLSPIQELNDSNSSSSISDCSHASGSTSEGKTGLKKILRIFPSRSKKM